MRRFNTPPAHSDKRTEGQTIVLGSARPEDCRTFEKTLAGTRWELIEAANWDELLHIAADPPCPVILFDRELPGEEWQRGVTKLTRIHGGPATVMISDVSDPYLWDELIQHGGFDILTRPLRQSDLVPMIEFAYTHWRTFGLRAITP